MSGRRWITILRFTAMYLGNDWWWYDLWINGHLVWTSIVHRPFGVEVRR